ncbi:MAG: hypothetical protein HOB40_06015 [Candidatus Marinimicrobia bacterium]|mgnify:FL=1|jgi:hypothetical protein|nr:hypothetical protein [Candidatus Neomarinimicrobiota bacterium]MBT3501409.1 hypothetical protein [Candidatus Neomarinimicrobiota bacterium]MBT3839452.1 hypothetical protein [Candidatus Neomarinimicrobiota bacterium]MBT3998563.1 hypothetical protein [Candidatus Neomarinimicrobiota bacterium]MBT4283035.1 hypothetical protein [Candidatus Neomarinimicrobiota bacterium]
MLKKIIINLLLSSGILFGGSFKLHPMVKSAILPGWGESSMHNSKRARLFLLTEISLLTAWVSAYTISGHQANQYQSFAVEHAGIDSRGKDHQYWVDIGNYSSMTNHNDEHLRFRDFESLYSDIDNWSWDSNKNQSSFENKRIKSDLIALTGKFIMGGIVVNHILSAIDALYLTRLEKIESMSLVPLISPDGSTALTLKINFNY